ncbi:hypothetical protein FACS1894101_1070 [Betaproteobacteria bacterium]|nr:hypothetical protein FACS1894101_1070 [Betaproteobacteria bacterium]
MEACTGAHHWVRELTKLGHTVKLMARVEQQDQQAIHRIRSLRVEERTATANQIRGLLVEYGIVLP